ncbi:MAG: thiol:disulfide interchange protein DsbA/DsbL [Lysobacterales bacterium]|nr:MAG: thiol:disulfide interchange protein DsbA/DsbL [Xanthomonadales bacterium]
MSNYFIRTIMTLALLLGGLAAQAQDEKPVPYQEGLHYFLIEGAPAQTSATAEIEVAEAFSYLCSHCSTFEPYIEAWQKRKPENVVFRRIPVVFGRDSWELYARGYVTAEMLNVGDEAHSAMMDRLWKEKKIMRSMDELADFYSQFGVDREKFLAAAGSFAVDSKIKRDQLKLQSYGITGTPSLIVNGKYRVTGNAAVPSFDVMLDVVNYLAEQERAVSQQTSAAAD